MKSPSRNVLISTLAGLASQIVRIAQQIAWVPAFLVAFGKEGYGEWLSLVGLVGYAAMSDLGVQVYWLNLLTGSYVRGNVEEYRRLFRAGIILFVAVGALVLLASIAFVALWGPSRVLGFSTIPSTSASAAFLVLVVSTLLTVLAGMVRGVFRTVGQNPRVLWFLFAQECATLVLIALVLVLRWGTVSLASAYAAIAMVTSSWAFVTVRRSFPELISFRFQRSDLELTMQLALGGSAQLASVLSNLLLIQGTLILTKISLGASAVALVATTRTLSNLVRQVAGSVYTATLPEFSRLEAEGDRQSMQILLRRSSSFVNIFSGLAVLAIVGIGPWVFMIWTGERFPDAPPLIYLFAASVVVDCLRMPLNDFLLGCNRIKLVAGTNVSYALASLALMLTLFPVAGVWAVPLSTIVSGMVIHVPTMLHSVSALIGELALQRLMARLSVGVVLVLLLSTILIVIKRFAPGIEAIVPATVLAILCYAWAAWATVLDPSDSSLLRTRFARLARMV